MKVPDIGGKSLGGDINYMSSKLVRTKLSITYHISGESDENAKMQWTIGDS